MPLPRVFVGLLVAAMSAACASSGSTAAPPAASTPSASGTFLWQDLVTTDVKAARAFYSALLGWEFEEASRGGRPYLLARTDAGPVGGLVDISGMKDASSHWVSYVRVAGIDRAIQQVEAAGGKVIVPPRTVGVGRAGVVADPQGAPLGLLEPSEAPPGDPGQARNCAFLLARVPGAGCAQGAGLLQGPAWVRISTHRFDGRARIFRAAPRQPACRAVPDSEHRGERAAELAAVCAGRRSVSARRESDRARGACTASALRGSPKRNARDRRRSDRRRGRAAEVPHLIPRPVKPS
jgi:predicted enzyme related to lactoylglutathione lyase